MGLKEDFERWIQYYENRCYPGDWLPDEERKCIGCAIARGYREEDEGKKKELTPPGGIIRRCGNFLLHQDPLIPIPGFLVIASMSVEHKIRSIADLDDKGMQNLCNLMYNTRRDLGLALKEVHEVEIQRFTIIQEERSKHFHVWLFPWLEWMHHFGGEREPELSKIRNIMQYASKRCSDETMEGIDSVLDALRRG